MVRTKLKDRVLPIYTKGEEIFNMTSHIIGGVLGIVATILCIVFASIHKNTFGVVSSAIYGSTMIILYTMSSIYHGLNPKRTAKKVFQILDHCSIFLLIAGSYTPFALCTIREVEPVTGWVIFGVIWGAAILGIILNSIDLKKYKKFSMICYLAMGWGVIFKISLLFKNLELAGFILLVIGGIAYTIGAVLYGMREKEKIYAFCISFIYTFRKFITIPLYITLCSIKLIKSK